MNEAKPFVIDKRLVWEAYHKVKENKIWNRMSSGCYFPKAVKLVEIPKSNGGTRPLGIPTIEYRIAQQVVVSVLTPILEPIFKEDSYGYRPGKGAHQAIAKAKERCYCDSLGA